MEVLRGGLGLLVMAGLAFLLGRRRRDIPWRQVGMALLLQGLMAFLMLRSPVGTGLFEAVNRGVLWLMSCSDQGARLLFGRLVDDPSLGASMAFQVLPVVVFVSALMGLLQYWGLIDRAIRLLARLFARFLRLSGAEAFLSGLLVFMGIEAITGMKRHLAGMERPQIFLVMVTFMSTIAGTVLVAYTRFGAQAGHLLTASLMSAPAAFLFARLMEPALPDREAGGSGALAGMALEEERGSHPLDALASGASRGLELAFQIGAMLLVFVALIHMLQGVLGFVGLDLQQLMGRAMAPMAWLMGIPWKEAPMVGELLGTKVLFTEFLSYLRLKDLIASGALSPRSVALSTYALCGFGHLASVAILLGGVGGLVPAHRPLVSRLAVRALVAATLATFSTAVVAGFFLQ